MKKTHAIVLTFLMALGLMLANVTNAGAQPRKVHHRHHHVVVHHRHHHVAHHAHH